jgi:Mor family transcriptional regulator
LTAEIDEAASLQHDVFCILMRFRRQYGTLPPMSPDISEADLKAYAAQFAAALGEAIGGRYIPKRDLNARARAARFAAIYEMWNGKNRDEVMRHFGITRRFFYTVISSEQRRRQAKHK